MPSPRQPLQQIAHHRLLHRRGLVGDDELLDAERSAEVDRADAAGLDLAQARVCTIAGPDSRFTRSIAVWHVGHSR